MISPAFDSDKKQDNLRKAFRTVAVFAAASFAFAAAGVYWSFFADTVAQTSFNLKSDQRTASLINPQPPETKSAAKQESETGNSDLIKEIEEHKKSVDATAESLKQKVESPEPENPAVAELHREQDEQANQKIAQIAALEQERAAAEQGKQPVPAIVAAHEESAKQEFEAYAPKKSAAYPEIKPKPKFTLPVLTSPDLKSALTKPAARFHLQENGERLPLPELVHTTLVESLPNFALIKQKDPKGVIPLTIVQPLPALRKDGLPVKASNGLTPFKAYAAPVEQKPETPYIAVLLSGLGRRHNVTESAVNSVPATVSLSFSPYAPQLKEYVENARKMGHETLLDLPMQHGTFPETDPGPLGLVGGLPARENHNRLHKIMGSDVAYIGLAAQRNQNFSYYAPAEMKKFAEEIASRGLVVIAGSDNADMPMFEKTVRPDIYIADNLYRAAIKSRLEKALNLAKKNGRAFIRIEAYPVTMVALIEFMKSLTPTEENPVPQAVFVPVSYYVRQIAEVKK